jgi:malonyl-CoA/methylmalonyl-CoA synthetase
MTSPPANLYDTLAAGFGGRMDDTCISEPGGRTFSYRQVDRRTAQVANLVRSLGVRAGDRVAAQVDKSAEGLFAYLGCLRAGAVFLPLNPAYKADEVAYFLGDAEPTLAIGRPDGASSLDAVAARTGVRVVHHLDATGAGSWSQAVDAAPASAPTVRCPAPTTSRSSSTRRVPPGGPRAP